MKLFLSLSLALSAQLCIAQTPIQFVNPIPEEYNPELGIPQFIDICPDITLPKGHFYFKPPTKQGWTMEQAMKKGVTHWATNSLESNDHIDKFRKNPRTKYWEYYAVPRIREIFSLPEPVNGKWWPNGPLNEKDARAKGRTISIQPRLWVGETMEGDDWITPENPMWGWFYDEVVKRYEAQKAKDGIPYYIAHNYFTQFPGTFEFDNGKREDQLKFYDTPPEKWDSGNYSPGRTLGKLNTTVEGIYINTPDLSQKQLLSAIFRMELAKMAGKSTGLFVFNVHEWHPGFAARIEYPEGIFYRKDKLPLDPNLQIALAFLSQEYGNIFIEWGLMPYQSPTKKPVDYYPPVHSGDKWYPKGETNPTKPFPFATQTGSNRFGIHAYLGDMTHFGILLWSQTGAQVAEGKPYYATYKLDGGDWVKRQKNGSDLVESYYEKRGVVRTRILGKKMLICYFNMFADNETHKLVVQNPLNSTETFVGIVSGNGVHATVVNLR